MQGERAVRLSVIILTKNEIRNIKDCMASVKDIADEIIVMDNGSTDGTPKLAEELGAKVYHTATPVFGGWGERRREAQQHCQGEFVLHLDADERVTEGGRTEIVEFMEHAASNAVAMFPRLTYFMGTPVKHCGWYPDYIARLYRNAYTSYNEAPVHEHLEIPEGSQIKKFRHPLLHYSYESAEAYFSKQVVYALVTGEKYRVGGKSAVLCSIPFKALFAFFRTYVLRRGFLDGKAGFIISIGNCAYAIDKALAVYFAVHGKKMRRS